MKIIFDATNIKSGGGIKHILSLQKNFGKYKSYNFEIYLNDKILENQVYKFDNCKIVYPWWSKFNFILRTILHLFFFYRVLKRSNPDFVLYPGSIIPFTCINYNPICLSQNMLPFYNLNHDLIFNIKLKILKKLYISSYKKSLAVFFLTDISKKIIEKQMGALKNSLIIPHAFDSNKLVPHYINKNFQKLHFFKLVYISPILSYKNQNFILDAINLLPENFKNKFSIDFIGHGSNIYFKCFLSKLALLKNSGFNVSYHGHIDQNLISERIKNYNGAIFASSCETLPFTILEIHENNIPLIISNIAPMKDFFCNDIISFDPSSPKSICLALIRLFSLDEYNYSISGLSKSIISMTWPKNLNIILNYLQNLKKDNEIVVK